MKKILRNKNTFLKLFTWIGIIFFLEGSFALIMHSTFSIKSIIHIILWSIMIATIFTIISNVTGTKKDSIITKSILFILGIMFGLQCVFYRIFKVYFSIYNLKLSNQLTSFMKETITLILENIFYILLFFLPFILYILLEKKRKFSKNKKEELGLYSLLLVFCTFLIIININSTKKESNSLHDLYHNINNVSLNIYKLGVINTYVLDIHRYLFGFSPKTINTISMESDTKEKLYAKNVLDITMKDTDNESIQMINDYIQKDTPTSKNEYTGIFKDYNLVYITAESFSEVGVSKELTPTLYKLIHSGFHFNNFYTPNVLSTIGGEFQSLTGLYPDYSILPKWKEGTNYFPFGMANVFQEKGYKTYAYHNNSYQFQARDKYMPTQGFDNFLACDNGLEERIDCERWPKSDKEMMEKTVDDYIHSEEPFLAYYMTVSGHFAYSFSGNSIASQNKKLVEQLDKSESAKAYVATQIELDRALETLINALKKEKKLDKTVFVLMADHYPYELDLEAINSLSSYSRDEIEVNHNSLIIWNPNIEDKEINKACMSIDVLPTIYNLFGVDYDSRLFTGKDILSDSFGVAIMSDYSWVTEKGTYYSSNNTFVPKAEVGADYVSNINQLINARLTISKMIIETDYYKYLYQE